MSVAAKALLTTALLAGSLFAIPTPAPPPAPRKPLHLVKVETIKGRWHMAENGHAVYCYGPVVVLNIFPIGGEPKRYATQCRGGADMVPLHD